MNHRLTAVSVAFFSGSLALVSACGGAIGEGVRPQDFTGTGALDAKLAQCTGDAKLARPLVIDLDADARLNLEASMKDGVVVVAYDCKSLRVLTACKASEAKYAYAGVSRKEQVVQLRSQDDLSVNLPLSAGKLGSEVSSGRTLDLALVLVGRRSTTLSKIDRAELSNGCEGATHFVQNASLGAFSIATGSVGKAAAVAELFKIGASGSSESGRKAGSIDGSLEACRTSNPDSPGPPSECRGAVRVELFPISAANEAKGRTSAKPHDAEGKKTKKRADDGAEAAAQENPCPDGYEFANGIVCTKAADTPHLCRMKDVDDCKVQCEKGSLDSCVKLGRVLSKTDDKAGIPYFKRACDADIAAGCSQLAQFVEPIRYPKQHPEELKQAHDAAQKACSLGSAFGCVLAGGMLDVDDSPIRNMPKALRAYERGCALGNGAACSSAATLYRQGDDGIAADIPLSLELMSRACQGRVEGTCVDLAEILVGGTDGVPKDVARGIRLGKTECAREPDSCVTMTSALLGQKQYEAAFEFSKMGCDGKQRQSCVNLGEAYASGQGTKKDPARAKQFFTLACEKGKGDGEACRHIGVKPVD